MAQYDIAAATKRISPVQEMMQYGLQQDARKINALNIQKAEIQMPYVEELTKQSVRRGELGIEEAETRMPYLESQLDQQKRATEVQIDLATENLKTAETTRLYREAVKSGEYSDAELQKAFPIIHGQQKLKQLQTTLVQFELLDSELNRILGMPEDQQARAYRESIRRNGAEKYMPPYEKLGPAGLREIVKRTRGAAKSATGELLQMYEEYKSLGTEEGNEIAAMIREALKRQVQGNLTQYETFAMMNFGDTEENPLQAQRDFDKIEKELENSINGYILNDKKVRSMNDQIIAQALEKGTLHDVAAAAIGDKVNEYVQKGTAEVMGRYYASGRDDRFHWYLTNRDRLDGKPESEWHKRPFAEPREITKEDEALIERAKKAEEASASASRVSAYTMSNPARPMTQAEFDALPVGSYFINPADNELRVKE